jgi:flagellar basal-body rod protein FlgG
VKPVASERVFTQGNLQKTDNTLDIAVNGQGFFQVTLPDGTLAYTRDGSFHLDSQGQLVSSSGYPLSPAITIPSNAQSITVARDGTVTITQPGQAAATQVGAIQLANFINAAGLQGMGENLYAETAASGTPTANAPGTNGLGVLQQGYVETSNVNVVEELVNMIQTQRAYEINSKAVQTSDQMLQRLSQI